MMNKVEFGSAAARPGHKAYGQLHVARGRKDVNLPVAVVHGARPGKHVVMMANQHGRELTGFESIRQFADRVDPQKMRGTVFAVLSMNPRAAMMKSMSWPEERHASLLRRFGNGPYPESPDMYRTPWNLNWIWPGRPDGSLAERVVHEVWTRGVTAPHRRADLVIDLHSFPLGYRTPVLARDEAAARLAAASGIPYIINTRAKRGGAKSPVESVAKICSVACAAGEAGLPSLTIEPAGQDCIVPEEAALTRVALFNMIKFLRMLPGKLSLPAKAYILDPWRSYKKTGASSCVFAYAPRAGLLVPRARYYDIVKKGDLLCELVDVYSGRTVKAFRAPRDGSLYDMTLGGICAKGDRVFGVSDFQAVDPARLVQSLRSLRQSPREKPAKQSR